MRSAHFKLAIDVGGTFTDFALIDALGGTAVHKVLTTPTVPTDAIVRGLSELMDRDGRSMADCATLVHGTTLVANAVIERRGAPTGMITTTGFRDVLEIGREQRYDIYDLFLQYPAPLVDRRWRKEVRGRISGDGQEIEGLDVKGGVLAAQELIKAGIESLAICLMNAYVNPVHERALSDAIRGICPELSISVSSDISREIGEFERFYTAVLNAYVQPAVADYLQELNASLLRMGFAGQIMLMQSSGGLMPLESAVAQPVRLLESGAAGAAMLTADVCTKSGLSDALGLEMGGTTAKLCVVENGRPSLIPETETARIQRFKKGSGIPVRIPVIDLLEIGAGGGSIAHKSSLGLLQIGPESAGADPGPACYGFGGTAVTVTDACALLGYLDPAYFLGGAMSLSIEDARAAMEQLAPQLELHVDPAWAIYNIVCENMAAAARIHVIERGWDPRRLAIVASGGAGPLYATRVAKTLGCTEVIVPPSPGVGSAIGFLAASPTVELSHSMRTTLRDVSWTRVDEMCKLMADRAAVLIRSAGVDVRAVDWFYSVDMRLAGQFHSIEVDLPTKRHRESRTALLDAAFRNSYGARFSEVLPGYEPLITDLRLRAVKRSEANHGPTIIPDATTRRKPQSSASHATRSVYIPEARGFVDVPVYRRHMIATRSSIAGPAIVEEPDSTTLIWSGDTLTIDPAANLRVSIAGWA